MKSYRDEQNRLIFGTTFIKAFRDPSACPKKLLEYYLLGHFEQDTTEAMAKGIYFEYGCLGATAHSGEKPDLPRLKAKDPNDPTGFKKSSDHLRIDMQIKQFPEVLGQLKVFVTEVQKELKYVIDDNFVIATKADIFGSIMDEVHGYVEEAYIDLKLTKDISNTFGDFQWHDPEFRDHTQAFLTVATHFKMTGRLAKFYYLVFDYKEDSDYKFVEKRVTVNDIYEFFETVRTVMEHISKYHAEGWLTNPTWQNCNLCKVQPTCPAIPPRRPIERI